MHKLKTILTGLLCALLITAGCQTVQPEPSASPTPEATPEIVLEPKVTQTPEPTAEPLNLSTTTGLPTTLDYRPVEVMVENSPEARPQSGFNQADVIYEAYVEGQITRFMLVYATQLPPEKVGPVRSARIYYLNLAQEWDGIYTHFGGANDPNASNVYKKFKQITLRGHLDGMTEKNYFWRDSSRKSPHNAYVNISEVTNLYGNGVEMPQTPRQFANFRGGSDAPLTGESVQTLTLPYSSFNKVIYTYNADTGLYSRAIGNKPFTDKETGKQCTAANIIVQYAKHGSYNDKAGHISIGLVGSGNAEYYCDGVMRKGTWEKTSETAQTVFKDEDGKVITLAPGNTYVQIVPTNFKVTRG